MLYINDFNIFTEEQLIKEMNLFILNTNVLNESTSNWANKILNKIYNFFSTSKNVSKKIINKITIFINNLLKKLSPEKKDKFNKYLKKFEKQMIRTVNDNLNKNDINDAVKIALDLAKNKNLIKNENIKESFDTNKDEILKLIKSEISKKLDGVKESVMSELNDIDNEVDESFARKSLKKLKTFSIGTSFMMAFGLIDNLGLFVGMSSVEDWIINMGFDSTIAAGIGNTFSDAVGVIFGGAMAIGIYKLLKVKGEGTIMQQLVGVVTGCLIPVIVKMLVMTI